MTKKTKPYVFNFEDSSLQHLGKLAKQLKDKLGDRKIETMDIVDGQFEIRVASKSRSRKSK
jgi:hypothetical protein